MKRLLVTMGLVVSVSAGANDETLTLNQFQAHQPMAKVLLLGTFHFKDAGRDTYKPEVDIDILSDDRQREIDAVLDSIAEKFRPTKIGIEARGEWADRIVDNEYPAWLDDAFQLKANEVYQLGFRLGKRLGHTTLYPIDATGRWYGGERQDLDAYAKRAGQTELLESEWDEHFTALYRHEDRAKSNRPITETLIAMNDPERLLAGHGHYLLGRVALGQGEEYPGADHLTGWWYNRNLRIFARIRRIAEPGDRILVVIGAGHVPILRHAVKASPEFRLTEVVDVLR